MNIEKYTKGFNDGYLLKAHKPQLLENILNTTSSNDYIQGLKDGERRRNQEKIKSRTQELKSSRTKNRDLGLERQNLPFKYNYNTNHSFGVHLFYSKTKIINHFTVQNHIKRKLKTVRI